MYKAAAAEQVEILWKWRCEKWFVFFLSSVCVGFLQLGTLVLQMELIARIVFALPTPVMNM